MLLQRVIRTFPLDWSPRRDFRLHDPSAQRLGAYYVHWDAGHGPYGEGWEGAPHDAAGVILSAPGNVYHPTRIAQYGLELHARWILCGDAAAHRAFLAHARWLRDHQAVCHGIPGCYPFPFPWLAYGASSGFLSAMTQGEAASLLLRAYEATSESGFLEAAILAAEPFRYEIGNGGVTWRADDDVYFEEAAVDPPSHILNGWIFALWGLYELRSYHPEPWLATLFNESLRTLRHRLRHFDSGYWSYYNLLATHHGFRKLATLKYHTFHIAQLHVLASMTGERAFDTVAERWSGYISSATGRLRVYLNAVAGLAVRIATHEDTVPGGARSVV